MQISYLKEMGMIFTYRNHQDVWNGLRESYEGMLNHLREYDNNFPGTDLAGEWRKHMTSELLRRRIKEREQDAASAMKRARKSTGVVWGWCWTLRWE